MADVHNQKPEAVKPKPDDDGLAHTLTVFAQSLAYSAAESPVRSAAQILDHTFGIKTDATVQAKFNNAGIHKPEEASFGTNAWKAEQLGAGIGMVVPMWLARKAMVGKTESKVAASLEHASITDKAFREAKLSAKTGLFYGALLTPTEDKDSSGNFLVDRLKQGANGYSTFGAMGYSSSFSSDVLGRTANSLESTSLHVIIKSPLQTVLSSSLVHGAISGVPGGLIQAQLGAMENGKPVASLQDFKENVVSMTMVGGTMGSAGLFKEVPAKNPLFPQSRLPASSLEPVTDKRAPLVDSRMPAPQFNIKFNPIEQAWAPEDVNKHMTKELRSFEYSPANINDVNSRGNWNVFHEWGVEKRTVPANVYRFPGVSTEIVVPSDYAAQLDKVRMQRLIPFLADHTASTDVSNTYPYRDRILPEEMAQVIMQLPQPDLVKTVDLLDHVNPWDLQTTNERRVEMQAKGETPDDFEFTTQADANIINGKIRFFNVATHDEADMHETVAHEWSHLLEDKPVVAAFAAAAKAESDGFFGRDYALENDHENWAVHLGERFLNADGGKFAELPRHAPARTLVMAKAVRNMLEERADNPSPKHQEFLARVNAADGIATSRLQKRIVADITKGDYKALEQKLKFLDIAATQGQSPEFFTQVIKPIEADVMPILKSQALESRDARALLANYFARELTHNYSPDKMPVLVDAFKNIDIYSAQTRLFQSLPEEGQKYLLKDLSENISKDSYIMLVRLGQPEGPMQQQILDALQTAQDNFTKEALQFHREHQPVPQAYVDWLEHADNTEGRLAWLQNTYRGVDGYRYADLTHNLDASAKREMIVGDAMSYIVSYDRRRTWNAVLKDLPQHEQVQLFRELGQKHDPAYGILADKIEAINATEFGAKTKQIRRESLAIMSQREKTPEFIVSNPRRLKDADSFLKAAKSLQPQQISSLIKDGALADVYRSRIDDIVITFYEKRDVRSQLEIFEAIPPSVESRPRIEILSQMANDKDPFVSAKALRLLTEIADKQLESLRQKAAVSHEGRINVDAYISSRILEQVLLGSLSPV